MKALLEKIRRILRDRRVRRAFTRFIGGTAAVVVFVTTYALILPAITLEREAMCGMEAHQHDDSCYSEELICEIPESDGHHHTDECYSVTREQICELEEHVHSEENGCYDEEGNLICELQEHQHDDSCYEEARTLICGQEESNGHHHGPECYEKVLTCGKEAHTHSEECYKDESSAVAASTSSPAEAAQSETTYTEETDESAAGDATTSVLPEEMAEENLSEGLVPTLDPLYMDAMLTKDTAFYYYHPEEGEIVEDSSVIDRWKKVDRDTELKMTDLVKVYLPYTIPAGSLNQTNQIARYRLPYNLHLTDEQIRAINRNENGVASSVTDSDTEQDNSGYGSAYEKYLGAEAVEGKRKPNEELHSGDTEYISAVVKAENVYNESNGEYEGQDLIFIFTPYTIEENQDVYDQDGNMTAKGRKVSGWFAVDFNMSQIDWVEDEADADLDNTTIGKTAEFIFAEKDKEHGADEIRRELRLVEKKQEENAAENMTSEDDEAAAEAETSSAAEEAASESTTENATEAETAAAGETADAATADSTAEAAAETGEKPEKFISGTLEATGDGYKITLDYTAEAKIPADADLQVREITEASDKEAYEACLAEARKQVAGDDKSSVDQNASRFFDIEIVVKGKDEAGEETVTKIEPAAPVSVNIQLSEAPTEKNTSDSVSGDSKAQTSDPTVLHFAEDGVERMESTIQSAAGQEKEEDAGEDGTSIHFESDSFSIYGVVYTVDFHWEVDGRSYEFTLPGGGFVSLETLLEVLKVTDGSPESTEQEVSEETQSDGKTDKKIEESQQEYQLTLDNVTVSEETRKFVADVEKAEFSNPELVWIGKTEAESTVDKLKKDNGLQVQYSEELNDEQIADINSQKIEAGDWALIGMKPFETEESLTITMKDGEIFTIRVTDAQIKKTVISKTGETYEITVTYGQDAQIPDGAELIVREILPEDEEYTGLYEEASKKASENAEKQGIEIPVVTGARLFDIEIHGQDGKIEPKSPVQVDIRLAGENADLLSVVHFAKDGAEVMELQKKPSNRNSSDNTEETTEEIKENLTKEVSFETDSFSVYTVVDVSSANLTSDGPYILVSGIQGDPGADVGYQENWGTDFFTKVVNGMAMTNETREHGLSSIGVHVWTEGTQGFVGGEATQWTFEQGTNGNYYIKDSSGKYLMRSSYTTQNYNQTVTHYDGMSLTGDRNAATQFTVTPTGDGDGSVYLTFTYQGQTWYLHNNQYGGSNEWTSRNYMVKQNPTNDEKGSSAFKFKLCKQSDAYDSFAATKVASTQVTTDGNYVIYHKFEDSTGNEELYALASDGTFVRVYDGGDRIYWRETDKNIYWNYQSGDGHHLISIDPSTNAPVYLNPIASGEGQTISTEDHYLTLNGKDNGEYGTTIERWDQVSYDYAGLHVVKDGNTVQLMPGTRNDGTSDEFLFALATSMPKKDEAEPVDTVDSDGLGIKITMFDYGNANTEYSAGTKLEEMTAIAGSDAYTPHEAHALVKPYLVSGLPANNSGDAMTGLFDTGGAITGKIEDVNHLFLQSYYDENGTFRYRSEDNYAYIPLDGSNKNFTVYSQVATPYTTDRLVGHAYYYHGHFMPFNDIDMNNHLSRLLDQYGTQELPLEDGRTYEDVYGITGTPNYYTGLKMEASFIQPSNGVLENGDDMVFKFTGDDDMWVYIDGILVLDIGGIHEPLSGTINFRTGEVTNPEGSSLEGTKTLYEIFMEVYNDPNTPAEVKEKISTIEWNGGTFADFTTHSFGAFYMERGAGASNLDLQFNLKIAKNDEFVVRKALPEGVDSRFVNQRFKYQATYIDTTEPDESKKIKPLYKGARNHDGDEVCLNVTYKDRKNPETGEPITVEVDVDNDGYFYLFAGEAAVFKVANETVEYDVKEVTIDQNIIKQVDINNNKNVPIVDDTAVSANGKIADADFAKVFNRGEVVYTNHPQTQNLKITKHLTTDSAPLLEGEMPVFEFRVYLESPVTDSQGNVMVQQGKPVTKLIPYSYGPYYLMKDGEYYTLTGENNAPVRQGTTPVICSTTGRSGSINSIPLEYTIVIPDIAVGTHFYLEERRDNIPNGYEYVEERLTSGTYDQEELYTGNPTPQVIERILARDEDDHQEFDPSTIGRIKNGVDAESHVYNRKPTIDIPVEKVWQPANNTPDSVSLALVRFKAPDQNQHVIIDGKGAILIHHYADYGNGDEALPGGFHATYTIKKKGTDEVVFSGTEDRTYDVDPGEYNVTTTVSRWGNVPSNCTPDESGSTHTTDVTVLADQSTTAILKSKYNIVADGKISISHTASYQGGSLSGVTTLPEGFSATYSIKDNATGRYVYTNVPAGEYDLAPGTYTVTAQISSIAAPQNYYYQRTTTEENVEVTSNNTTSVTLTSSYEFRDAPPVNGSIQFSHVSAGLPNTTNLPEGFQANVVIKGPAKTIENASAGSVYDVPPGEYQIYVQQVYNNGTLPEGYFYSKTDPITVVVASGQPASGTLTSTFGQGGYLTIAHQSQGINGTSPNMPDGFTARYTITNQTTGNVVQEYAQVNTEYAVPPGEYIIEMAQIYGEGSHQNFNYVSTNTATVTVNSGDRETATLTSIYERAGGNNTDVYLCVDHSPNDSGTHITVPINSEVILKYHGFDIVHSEYYTEHINPPWELHSWNGYRWEPVNGIGGDVPGNQGVTIAIGDKEKYCVLIKTASANAYGLDASIDPVNANGSVYTPNQQLAFKDSAANTVESMEYAAEASDEAKAHSFTVEAPSFLETLFGPVVAYASEPNPPSGNTTATSTRDMSKSEVQSLVVPNTFVIPETYTLDKDFGKMLTLTNPWKYTFEDLPEYDKDGNEYYYAIIEVEVPTDYEVSYSPQQPVKASDIRANMLARAEAEANHQTLPDLLTLTATNTTTIVEGDLQVTKTVKLNGDTDSSHGGADLTFYVGLFESETADTAIAGTVKPITVQNGSATGTVTYPNLRVGNQYYVYETDEQGHKLATGQKTNGYYVTVNGGQSDPITVTPVVNVYVENERRTGDLELNKNVTGTGADTTKQFEFTIELTPPAGESLAASYSAVHSGDSAVTTAVISEGNKVTGVKLRHGEKYTIKNLPEGTAYRIIENNYSLIGYASSMSNGEGTIARGDTGKVAVTVTNTYEATQVTLKKVDVANLENSNLTADDLLKGAAFRITKYEDKNFRGKVTDWETNGSIELADVKDGDNYTLNGTFTFTNLPKGFYLIEETAFPNGYIRLEDNPRFEVGDDMKVYLLDENGDRIGQNITEILRVLPVTDTQTENVLIYGNEPGAPLPSTGGPGTHLFYLLGSALAIFAAVLLGMRRIRH